MPRLTIHVAGCPRVTCLIPRDPTEAEQAEIERVTADIVHAAVTLFGAVSHADAALLELLTLWQRRLSSDG